MLLLFSIKNFKTFKEKASLSLVASNYDKKIREGENVFVDSKYNLRVLKSAVIYGANASGKSKFIEALNFMKRFVVSSSKDSQKGEEIPVDPFRLSTETENEPSEFEVLFITNGTMYRYGFEVTKSAIISEWLFYKPHLKEIELFYRDLQNFKTHPRLFTKGATLVREELIRNNALFLSVAAQFNDGNSMAIVEWFKNLGVISGIKEEAYQGYTMRQTEDADNKSKILALLKAADLGIQDIRLDKSDSTDINKLPKSMPMKLKETIVKKIMDENATFVFDTITYHKKFGPERKSTGSVGFSMDNDESSGTIKFFALSGPILDTIEKGHPLFIDELDAKLHPNLVCKLASLFNSTELNPKNSQLVFNTHDTNLLSSGLFRRDQIWFAEKDKFGEARLYSLSDFKSNDVRSVEAFEDNYVRGKYGAVPFLGFFDELVNKNILPQDENTE